MRTEAAGGHSMPTYSYARNNPLAFVDIDGNGPIPITYAECVTAAIASTQKLKDFAEKDYGNYIKELRKMPLTCPSEI